MYEYRAKIFNVVDGDTVDASIDLGIWTYRQMRLRLYGINTPELHDPNPDFRKAAFAARDYMITRVLNKDVLIKTHIDKSDKYGRLLAEIFLTPNVSVNDVLVQMGLAIPYMTDRNNRPIPFDFSLVKK